MFLHIDLGLKLKTCSKDLLQMASTPECPALSEEDVKYLDNISYWYPFNSNLQGLSYKNVVWKNAKTTYLLALYERS